jgi:hypothetical protein
MRFWLVNQNQTWRQEIGGSYLWWPKRKANNQLNPFYESMREVSPGGVVLSHSATHSLLRSESRTRIAMDVPSHRNLVSRSKMASD